MTDHRCNIMVSIDCNEGFYDTSPVHYRSILIIDGVAARLCDETTPFCVKPTLSYLMEAKIMRAKYTINYNYVTNAHEDPSIPAKVHQASLWKRCVQGM